MRFNALLLRTVFSLFFFAGCANFCAADDKAKFVCDIQSSSFVESARCEYYEAVFSPDSIFPVYNPGQYDKTFLGTANDMNFKLKTNVNDNIFMDFTENLYLRYYNDEEPLSLGHKSYRYNEINHLFNAKLGINSGEHDYFQLDFYNSILNFDYLEVLNSKSNRGSAMFSHEFDERACLSIIGNIEEREFEFDTVRNYKESRVMLAVSSLLPSKNQYIQIADSARGSKEYFKTIPGTLKPRRAIDYYTDYETNPYDSDPGAKYMRRKNMGEVIIKGFGEMAAGELTELTNEYKEMVGGFEVSYEAAENMALRLNEVYRKTEYDRESMLNYLYDNSSNYIAIALDHDLSETTAQTLTFSNERLSHKNAETEDYKVNAVTYEGFYSFGRSTSTLLLGTAQRRFDNPALYYPDENEFRFNLGYDFLITDSIKFMTKGELTESEYKNFENELYSTYNRKSLRAAIKKTFTPYSSLELAYQQNIEKHDTFTSNNVEEKIVGLTFNANF